MPTQPTPYITEEQYLEIERNAEQRSEYFQGEMFPMEASTFRHATIHANLVLSFGRELAGSRCRLWFNELRLRVSPRGLYTYPDILVICGKPEFTEKDPDTVTNPRVIVEILSPKTGNYDRGDKFFQYRSIPSFIEYVLAWQDRIHVEHHIRQSDGGWLMHDISDPNAIISLESIGVRFKLSDAYDGVEL